jgi:hypothetical protein
MPWRPLGTSQPGTIKRGSSCLFDEPGVKRETLQTLLGRVSTVPRILLGGVGTGMRIKALGFLNLLFDIVSTFDWERRCSCRESRVLFMGMRPA